MKRLLSASSAALAALALLMARPAAAATATNTLSVSANVVGHCTIPAATLAFGNYDATGNIDLPFDITVNCTPGVTYWLGLGPGNNGAATRRMTDGTSFLAYELYRDNTYATVWDNTAPATPPVANLPGLSAYTFQVFARLQGGQVVPVGVYNDSVLMTLNF